MGDLANEFYIDATPGLVSPLLLDLSTAVTGGGVYMARLGAYEFALETAAFQNLTRQTEYRWPTHKRINRAPAAQFTGQDEDTIELSGVIIPAFRGGMGQLGLMRATAAAGEPLPLTYAFESVGQYCGLWCIRGVREQRTEFFSNGAPRRVEFSLQLVAYGEDTVDAATVGGLLSPAALGLSGIASPVIPIGGASAGLDTMLAQVNSLPKIVTASPLADVNSAAAAVSGVIGSVSRVAAQVRGTIQAGVGSLRAGVGAILPPDTMTVVLQLDGVAQDLVRMKSEADSAVAVFKDQARAIKSVSTLFGGSLGENYHAAASISGSLQSVAARIGKLTEGISTPALDRAQAGAFAGNMRRSADQLIHATVEGRAQLSAIAEKIDVDG